MLSASPVGFKNARVVFWLVIGTIVAPMVVASLELQYRLNLQLSPFLTQWHQWSRIPLNGLFYSDQVAVILGALLIYETRAVERLLGSRKYAVLVAQITAGSVVAMPLALLALASIGINLDVSSGPTALVAGLLTVYHGLVPPVYRFEVAGAGVYTDHALLYLVASQLVIRSWGSALKAFIGWFLARIVLTFYLF